MLTVNSQCVDICGATYSTSDERTTHLRPETVTDVGCSSSLGSIHRVLDEQAELPPVRHQVTLSTLWCRRDNFVLQYGMKGAPWGLHRPLQPSCGSFQGRARPHALGNSLPHKTYLGAYTIHPPTEQAHRLLAHIDKRPSSSSIGVKMYHDVVGAAEREHLVLQDRSDVCAVRRDVHNVNEKSRIPSTYQWVWQMSSRSNTQDAVVDTNSRCMCVRVH
ncbi:uncharacterized protein B0H18DRAFT_86898 [Fomitopsis serialis]|uniref:uncharacterized protein n=1 Tax=Fomitopsis serialis TaxID=139415 RepID=UPI0020084F66|nr:uncharacterized protein B0H18DRAFT_86898 [Neoantrodia serialis]KAH9931532.1 hypothetical protein B0H18DRAFT_86898 [Neoantrodia serialis]